MDELVVGKWKILEPPRERWGEPGKEVSPERARPGDRARRGLQPRRRPHGQRPGLLRPAAASACGPTARWSALCYECQLFDDLIVGPHDVFMDKVVTEQAVYRGQGRRAQATPDVSRHARRHRRHLRRGVPQHLRRGLITARDRTWLDHAVARRHRQRLEHDPVRLRGGRSIATSAPAATNRSPRPTAGPGAIVQFHVPRFRKDRVAGPGALAAGAHQPERAHLPDRGVLQPARLGPTTFKLGRKIAYFGDGYQLRDRALRPQVWWIPIARRRVRPRPPVRLCRRPDGRQPVVLRRDRRCRPGRRRARRGARSRDARRDHAVPRRHRRQRLEGGQPVQVHGRQHLREVLPDAARRSSGAKSQLPAGVALGAWRSSSTAATWRRSSAATQAAIAASVDTPGLVRISAGNYGGRLGKSFIYLHPDKQPPLALTAEAARVWLDVRGTDNRDLPHGDGAGPVRRHLASPTGLPRSPPATPAPVEGGWVRYRHKTGGFSLEHPPAGPRPTKRPPSRSISRTRRSRPTCTFRPSGCPRARCEEFAEMKFGVQPELFKPLGPARHLDGPGWTGLVQDARRPRRSADAPRILVPPRRPLRWPASRCTMPRTRRARRRLRPDLHLVRFEAAAAASRWSRSKKRRRRPQGRDLPSREDGSLSGRPMNEVIMAGRSRRACLRGSDRGRRRQGRTHPAADGQRHGCLGKDDDPNTYQLTDADHGTESEASWTRPQT